jgi:sugar-specific transcriptional regulator TrmB
MKDELIKLGLTKDESGVYLTLLELGQSSAGPIVKKTSLHRQQVYDTLEKLKQKRLLSETIKANRKHWTASHPEAIKQQLKATYELSEQLLPDLVSLYSLSSHKQDVRIYEGPDGFKSAHEYNIIHQPKNSTVPVIGANGEAWTSMMKQARYLNLYEKRRIEKNITHELLFFEKERAGTQEVIKKYFENNPAKYKRVYKYLPDEFQSPVGMQLWQNNITLIIYAEPVTIIQITNPLIVNQFKKYAEFLWKMARK